VDDKSYFNIREAFEVNLIILENSSLVDVTFTNDLLGSLIC